MYKKILTAAVLLLVTLQFSFSASDFEKQFIKGGISQKTTAVLAAAEENDYSLAYKAIDFAIQNKEILGEDKDLLMLLRTAVQAIENNSYNQNNNFEGKLIEIFNNFTAEDLRISILDIMSHYPSTQIITLINNFLTDNTMKKAPMNPVILKAITVLGKIGNTTSFQLLFAISLNHNWSEYDRQLDAAIAPLAASCEREILQIMNIAPIDDKLEIMALLSRIQLNSQKILGEVAEIALAASIYNIGNSNEISQSKLNLQLEAIRLLAKAKWTRSSATVTNFFPTARKEYSNGLITNAQFAEIIINTAEIASGETASVLSSYLDSLNKDMENGKTPDPAVLMAVIKALGSLGDKSAFDYLLSVTYLDYSEEISSAAKQALSELKW